MKLLTGFLVGAPVWLAIGVYIGLRLVWAGEPETVPSAQSTLRWWTERRYSVTDLQRAYAQGQSETDDWATDPYTTALTEAHA